MAKERWRLAKNLTPGIFLIVFSTLCFYVPSSLFGLKGFDVSSVPVRFYRYYAWMMVGAFSLNIMYAAFLFYFIPPRKLFLKVPVCWLIIAETYTLVYHIINKIYLLNVSSELGKYFTLVLFTICCLFFLYRAIIKPISDKFDPRRTYIIRYLPKNTIGIFNYVWNHSGHKGLYQDGNIYKFDKESGLVQLQRGTFDYFKREDISLKEIPRINDIGRIVGIKYSLMRFNCNQLINYATKS